MSIVPLKKATLAGRAGDKAQILADLQTLGCLHLLDLTEGSAAPEKDPSERDEAARSALKYLKNTKRQRRFLHRERQFDRDAVVREVLDNQQRLRALSDRRDFLINRLADLSPWGDFHFPEDHALLGGYFLWFYILPHKHAGELERLILPWQLVHASAKSLFIVVLSKQEPPVDLLPVARTHTGAQPLSRLQQELEDVELNLDRCEGERELLTRFILLLRQNLNAADDHAARIFAQRQTLDNPQFFVLQGWVPVDQLKAISDFSRRSGLALELADPAAEEQPPSLLKNPEALAAGETLSTFYQTPAYREWDPSLLVFFSFALFFSMILSDAGYAVALSLPLLFFWRRLSASVVGRRFRNLWATLCGSATVYGVLVGGYFGVSPGPDSLLGQVKLLDVNNFDAMMIISVVIGAGHIALANGIVTVRNWGTPLAWVHLGWITTIAGSLSLWLAAGNSSIWTVGEALVALGLATVFLFSSSRPVDSFTNLALRLVDGLRGWTRVTKAFGDILSYLRLFALGLASAMLALTFNQIGQGVIEALPGIGLLLGGLIILVGHTLNLGLAMMSGVIHGLRLNFIEFYGWGLSEEGYPFKAFARKENRS